MQIRFHLHEKYAYPEIVICGHEMNEELNASMIRMMEQSVTPHLGGNIDVYA